MRLRNFRLLARDMVDLLRRDKKLWWIPVFIILLILGGIFVAVTLMGPLATFIYPFL